MFKLKKKNEEEELKKMLREGWPADDDEERTKFLHRLKLVLPPDHPGLLCLQGKSKKVNGNGISVKREFPWRYRRAVSLVATWGFVLAAVFLTYFGVHGLVGTSPGDPGLPAIEGTSHPGSAGAGIELTKETSDKFIYRFQGTEITRTKYLSLEQLNMEISSEIPGGFVVTITGMQLVGNYLQETDTTIYNITVFELFGTYGRSIEEEEEKPEFQDLSK